MNYLIVYMPRLFDVRKHGVRIPTSITHVESKKRYERFDSNGTIVQLKYDSPTCYIIKLRIQSDSEFH